jgi:hypothetical protein
MSRITNGALRGGDVAPPALHNSGPVPRSVHYTAGVGATHRLDLGTLLHEWTELPSDLRSPMALTPPGPRGPSRKNFAPPEKAAGIARFLLDAIAPIRGTEQELAAHRRRVAACEGPVKSHAGASASIAALAERVSELGWLKPFHGLVQWKTLDNPSHHARGYIADHTEFPWLPAGDEHQSLRHAWCVCAASYMSPPLLLWSREPSLTWWRGDNVIELRWFGRIAR